MHRAFAIVLLAATAALSHPALAGPTLEVGRMVLHRCEGAAWCGVLPRALDPQDAGSGTVPIYFEYYPHTGARARVGTLGAAEGGPGYSTTDSRDDYLALFGPLREGYDVLLMDYRGTGRSDAIDCTELQRAPQLTERNIGACGESLGRDGCSRDRPHRPVRRLIWHLFLAGVCAAPPGSAPLAGARWRLSALRA